VQGLGLVGQVMFDWRASGTLFTLVYFFVSSEQFRLPGGVDGDMGDTCLRSRTDDDTDVM